MLQWYGGVADSNPEFFKESDSEWDSAVQWYNEQVEKNEKEAQQTRKKTRVGIIRGLIALLNAPQSTGTSGSLAMRTSRRSRK